MLNYAGAVPDDHNDHKNSSEDEVSSYENDFWLAANRIQKTPISNRLKQTGFVSSLDYPTQLIFKKIYSLWSETQKNTPELLSKLEKMLNCSENSFMLGIKLFNHIDQYPKENSLTFGVLRALQDLKKKLSKSTIARCLDDQTKTVAFCSMFDKNLMTIKIMTKVFELAESNHLFVRDVEILTKQKKFKQAGQITSELKLGDKIGFYELHLPLLLESRIGIFEDCLKNAEESQIEVIRFLDSLIQNDKSFNNQRVKLLFEKYHIKSINVTQFQTKTVNKLLKRLLTKFNIDKSLAPNHVKFNVLSKLRFLLNHHYEGKSCRSSFEDNIKAFLSENDSIYREELLRCCTEINKLEDAAFFAEKYKIPASMWPRELSEFIREYDAALEREDSSCYIFNNSSSVQSHRRKFSDSFKAEQFHILNLSPSAIFVIDSLLAFWKMLYGFHSDTPQLIGFDTEHTTDGQASIIQVATRRAVFIIDVITLLKFEVSRDCWKILSESIFNNDEVLKIGFELQSDYAALKKIPSLNFKYNPKSHIDLKVIGTTLLRSPVKFPFHQPFSSLSLSKLTQLCFGDKLDKGNQLSVWTQRPLTSDQLGYAALDAFVLLEIHDIISGLEDPYSFHPI